MLPPFHTHHHHPPPQVDQWWPGTSMPPGDAAAGGLLALLAGVLLARWLWTRLHYDMHKIPTAPGALPVLGEPACLLLPRCCACSKRMQVCAHRCVVPRCRSNCTHQARAQAAAHVLRSRVRPAAPRPPHANPPVAALHHCVTCILVRPPSALLPAQGLHTLVPVLPRGAARARAARVHAAPNLCGGRRPRHCCRHPRCALALQGHMHALVHIAPCLQQCRAAHR